MIVLSDPLFLYSVSFSLYFLVIGIVYSLSLFATMVLMLFLPVSEQNEMQSQKNGIYALAGFAENILMAMISTLTSIIVHIFKSFLFLFPFFVLAVILATTHRNYQTILVMLENSYNLYLADTEFVQMLQVSAWFGKVTAEIVVPVWNFIIDTGVSLVRNLGYYFTTSPATRQAVLDIVQSVSAVFSRGSAAIIAWIDVLRACRYSQWVESVSEVSGTPACLQFRHREIDLESTFEAMQKIGISLVNIFGIVCPISRNVIELVAYPLSDENLSAILSAAVNFFIQLAFDVWDVTAMRCRLVLRLDRSKVFCVPDVKPLIYYPHNILEMTGELLDNWLEELCKNIFGILMRKKEDDGGFNLGVEIVPSSKISAVFGTDEVKLMRLSGATMVYTNGVDALYSTAVGNGEQVIRNAFRPAVDLRYGVAPIVFVRESDEVDFDGFDKTSMLGCGCVTQDSVMKIYCSVARFSRSASYRREQDDTVTEIPVDFEVAYSSRYLSCETVQVSVQPVNFPQISSDVSDDRMESRGQSRQLRECLSDPSRCQDIDALVYVKPVCYRQRRYAQDGTVSAAEAAYNRNRVACTSNNNFQPCFPYCVGMHYKGQGNYPITLYGSKTIQEGIFKTNVFCEAEVGEASADGLSTVSATFDGALPVSTDYAELDLGTKWTANVSTSTCSYRQGTRMVERRRDAPIVDFQSLESERVGYEWQDLQPFAFAGDSILVPSCQQVDGRCSYTVSLHRLTSGVSGQYRMMPILQNIPAEHPSSGAGGWQADKITTSSLIRIPYTTYDASSSRNVAVQTWTGIFYAVNPDTDTVCRRFTNCPGQVTTEFCSTSQFRGPRLFMTRPRFECSRGDVDSSQVFLGPTRVRACTQELTREVVFEGNDAFWSSDNLQGLFDTNTSSNLYIRDLSLFDESNVMVTVTHGFVSNILFEMGVESKSARRECYESRGRSSTRVYFVHVRTLQVRENRPWTGMRSKNYARLAPDFFSVMAQQWILMLEGAGLVANEFVLNLVGISELLLVESGEINTGKSMGHHVFDMRQPNQPPLSLNGISDEVSVLFSKTDRMVLKALRYAGIFMGLPVAAAHWSHSAFLIFYYLSMDSMLGAWYTLNFMWDDVLLPFLRDFITSQRLGTDIGWFRIANNNVFDAITNGRLDATLLSATHMVCNRVPHLAVNADGPTGSFLFHACNLAVEQTRFVLTAVSTMITFSDLNTCICQTGRSQYRDVDVEIRECVRKLPRTLQADYESYWLNPKHRDRFNQLRPELCRKNINAFRTFFGHLPDKFLNRADLALKAAQNMPSEITNAVGISVGDYEAWSCSHSDFSDRSHVTTITPQPIHAFERCAYTKNCQQKCAVDIAEFYHERAKALNPNVFFNGEYNSKAPATYETILGLSEERDFSPLAIQDYGRDVDPGCDRYVVVVGRPFQLKYTLEENPALRLYRLCYTVSNIDGIGRLKLVEPSVELEQTKNFLYFDDSEGDEEVTLQNQRSANQIISIMLPPSLRPGTAAMVMIAAWRPQMHHNGVFYVEVSLFGEQQTGWLVQSSTFAVNSGRMCFLQQIGQEALGIPEEGSSIVFDEDPPEECGDNCVDAASEDFSMNPVFESFSVTPSTQNAEGGAEWGLLARFSMYLRDDTAAADLGQLVTFAVFLNFDIRGSQHTLSSCHGDLITARTFSKSNPSAVISVLAMQESPSTHIMVEELPRAELCPAVDDSDLPILSQNWCKRFGLALFERDGSNALVKRTAILDVVNATLKFHYLRNLYEKSGCDAADNAYCAHVRDYGEMTLELSGAHFSQAFGKNIAPFVKYSRMPSFRSLKYSAVVLRLNLPTHRHSSYGSWLATDQRVSSLRRGWFREFRIDRAVETDDDLWKVVNEGSQFFQTMSVRVEGKCNFMSCGDCNGLALQRACYAAENCAIRRCISTTINLNNIFCVLGSAVKEFGDYAFVDAKVAWNGFVNLYMGIFEFAQGRAQARSVHIEALSDYYVSTMCETKDLIAVASSLIPSLIATVQAVAVSNVQKLRAGGDRLSPQQEQTLSPQNRLRARTVTTYATEIINQFMLAGLYILFVPQKLIICGADQIAQITGGFINIVNNDFGEDETSVCQFNDNSRGGMLQRSDREVIMDMLQLDSTAMDIDADITVKRGLDDQLVDIFASFASAIPRARTIQKRYKNFVALNNLNGVTDWFVGVLWSIARIMGAFESAECRPNPTYISDVTRCVCEDKPFSVASERAREDTGEAALWCTGILKMADQSGFVRYIKQPLSFARLKQLYDPGTTDSLMRSFLDCTAAGDSSCRGAYEKLFAVGTLQESRAIREWRSADINPLAVLTRCRQNFNDKTWDEGAFALFNPEEQQMMETQTNSISPEDLVYEQLQLNPALLGLETIKCLTNGPAQGSIQACMFLFFQHRQISASQYFAYTPAGPSNSGVDACMFLSTPAFLQDATYGQQLQTCQDNDYKVCFGQNDEKSCKIRYSTRSLQASSTSNVVDTYSTRASQDRAEQLASFEEIRACSLEALESEISAILTSSNNAVLDNLDYSLDTFEGDSLHQQVDCIFMGAYNRTFILPADREGVLESLMYSRHVNGSSRRFEMPCAQKILHDSRGGNHSSNTCGTDTRQSAMMYVKALFSEDSGVNEKIKQAMLDELNRVHAEFSDLSRYECHHRCCSSFDESCIGSSEVNFDPNILANMDVDVSQFISSNEKLRNIQYTALTNITVSGLRQGRGLRLACSPKAQRWDASARSCWSGPR